MVVYRLCLWSSSYGSLFIIMCLEPLYWLLDNKGLTISMLLQDKSYNPTTEKTEVKTEKYTQDKTYKS